MRMDLKNNIKRVVQNLDNKNITELAKTFADNERPPATQDISINLANPSITSSGYEGGDDYIQIVCDFPIMEPFEGDIKNLVGDRIKDIMEVAEEDPNAYSYEESEMEDL